MTCFHNKGVSQAKKINVIYTIDMIQHKCLGGPTTWCLLLGAQEYNIMHGKDNYNECKQAAYGYSNGCTFGCHFSTVSLGDNFQPINF